MQKLAQEILKKLHPEFGFSSHVYPPVQHWFVPSRPLYILGLGKSAPEQVFTWGKQLAERGIVADKSYILTKNRHDLSLPETVEQSFGSHPIPDEQSLSATQELLKWLKSLSSSGQLLVFLSGGGSSLLEELHPFFSLEDLQELNDSLVNGGASIEETVGLRKVLSRVKNGGLLSFFPQSSLSLITCDVPSRDVRVVSSAPTVYTPLDREWVIERSQKWLSKDLAFKIIDVFNNHDFLEHQCHLKSLSPLDHQHQIIFDCQDLLKATLSSLGTNEVVSGGIFSRSSEFLIDQHYQWILEARLTQRPLTLLHVGEAPVSKKNGAGGRCTHFVAAMTKKLFFDFHNHLSFEEKLGVRCFALASDGDDGHSKSSGGWIDFSKSLHCNPVVMLERGDSALFLKQCGTLFEPQRTGTNLMDVYMTQVGVYSCSKN